MGTDFNQPRQLFIDTLADFHKKLGDREFFADPNAQDVAVEALSQDYLRTEHGEAQHEDAISLVAALEEYHKRRIALNGLSFSRRTA